MYCTMSTIRTLSRPALSTRSVRRVMVRSSADTEAPKDNASSTTPQSSTVFYAGNTYNEEQVRDFLLLSAIILLCGLGFVEVVGHRFGLNQAQTVDLSLIFI